jgi:ribonuclease P protein component
VRKFFQFTSSEVTTLFKHGKACWRDKRAVVLAHPQKLSHPRLLIVTPAALGDAHKRNLIRRQIKHIWYHNRLFEQGGTYDLVLIVRRTAFELSYDQLEILIQEIASRCCQGSKNEPEKRSK